PARWSTARRGAIFKASDGGVPFMFTRIILSAALLLAAGCAHSPLSEKSGASSLTVMSYNIRIGAGPEGPFGSDAAAQNLQGIADFIVESNADIVLLQEVDRNT